MLCSNCGKDTPFVGKVCPWCHHNNKENYQLIFAMVCISAVIGVVLGGPGATHHRPPIFFAGT